MSQFQEFVKSIENDDLNKVQETYVKSFLDRQIVSDSGHKPIHLACEKNSVSVLQFFLDLLCDFEMENKDGYRPIHVACRYGSVNVAKLLLEYNCEIDALTKDNETPLHICCQYGRIDIIKLLDNKGCLFDVPGMWGFYPIHVACQYGQLDTLKLLLDSKCDKNPYNEFGYQPLHIACKYGQTEILKYLLILNFEINFQKEWSGEPIHLACQYGHVNIVKALLDKKCQVNNLTRNGYTALHFASENGHLDIIKLLLVKDATVNILNDFQKTPVQLAQERHHDECETLLNEWFANRQVVEVVRNRDLKLFKTLFTSEAFEKTSYTFRGSLLDLSIDINADKITEFFLRKTLSSELQLSKSDLLSYRDSSDKLPSRIFQEFIVLKALKSKCEKLWNQAATIDIINGKCTSSNLSFIELAARHGNVKFMKLIMEMLLEVDQTWDSAIQIAVQHGHSDVVIQILKRTEFINTRKLVKMNRLHIAIDDNRADVVKYLIRNHICDPDISHSYFGLPLHMAYVYGRVDCITILEPVTRNIIATNMLNQDLLHLAISCGTLESVSNIISKTNNFTERDIFGCTYLHNAVLYDRPNIIDDLLEKDCLLKESVTDLDKYIIFSDENSGKFPINSIMPISNNENCFTLCLKIYGSLFPVLEKKLTSEIINTCVDGNSNSLLHISAILLLPQLCLTLLGKGASVDKENAAGNTALQEILSSLSSSTFKSKMESVYETVYVLVSNGADVNKTNQTGLNCIQISLHFHDELLTEKVISFSRKIDITKKNINFILTNYWITVLKKVITSIENIFLTKDILMFCLKVFKTDDFVTIWKHFSYETQSKCFVDLLYETSLEEHEETFKFLNQQNFNNCGVLKNGETILTILIKENKIKFFYHLFNSESFKNLIDEPNKNGWTPLHFAAQQYNLDLFEKILDKAKKIDHENKDGDTEVMILLKNIPINENNPLVKLLIQCMILRGVDVYKVSSNGQRPFDLCKNASIKAELKEFVTNMKVVNDSREYFLF